MPSSTLWHRLGTALTALLLMGQTRAGDVLPDPRDVRTAREAVQAVMSVPRQLGLPGSGRERSTPHPPAYARKMALSVVQSLDRLSRQTAGLQEALTATSGDQTELRRQLETAVEQIGHGLNLWRTSIAFERRLLAQEETSALAAKDLERVRAEEQARLLTLERDNARKLAQERQTELATRLSDLTARTGGLTRDQASTEAALRDTRQRLAQLQLLLPTAGDSPGESGLLREQARLEADDINLSKTRMTLMAEQEAQARLLAETRYALEDRRDPPELKRLDRELGLWNDTLETIDRQRAEIRRNSRNAFARAEATAADEQKQLREFLRRGQLAGIARLSALSDPHAPGSGFFDLGGLYRMGDFSTAHRNEELPDVNAFVVAFMNGAPNNPNRYDQDKRS